MAIDAEEALARIRDLCLSFPEASERLSHGSPTFFIRGRRAFVTFKDDHHGDGRLAIWCAAPDGAQAAMVETDPRVHYVPPYVGHLGWVGVRLDRAASWEEVAAIVEEAYLTARSRLGERRQGISPG